MERVASFFVLIVSFGTARADERIPTPDLKVRTVHKSPIHKETTAFLLSHALHTHRPSTSLGLRKTELVHTVTCDSIFLPNSYGIRLFTYVL